MNPVNQTPPVRPSPSEVDNMGENSSAQLHRPVSAPVSGSLTQGEPPSGFVDASSTTDVPVITPVSTAPVNKAPVNANALVPSGSSDAPAASDADAPAAGATLAATARLVDVGAGMTVLVTGSAPVASGAAITVVLPTSSDQDASTGSFVDSGDADDTMMGATSLQLSIASTPDNATPVPTVAAQQPPVTEPGVTPSLGALLRRPTEIRRDRTPIAVTNRVVLPRPSAADIEVIDALYANGGDWASLVTSVEQARPYELPRARYVMTIDTGRAFEHTGINKIMASFLKENGNAVVTEQIRLQELGQISKGRAGEIRVKVKSRGACERLARQEVKILGGKYVFQDFDILADRFYIDISSVDSNFNNEGLLRAFFEIKSEPIYDTFRDVNLASGMTTATWRVYFRSTTCPDALSIRGFTCDQVIFGGRMYPAQARDTPFPSQRRGFGQVSPHALNLDRRNAPPSPAGAARSPGQPTRRSYSDAVARTTPRTDSASVISVGTHAGSLLTPPGSPQTGMQSQSQLQTQPQTQPLPPPPPPPLALPAPTSPGPADIAPAPKAKGKRSRNADDFANMLQKSRPKPVQGIATSNYFGVLGSVDFELDCCNASLSDSSLPRFQIVPRQVKGSEMIKTSTEASHFLTKNHTKVEKTKEPTSIQEILAELETTEHTADLQLQSNHLAAADAHANTLRKTLRNTANPDTIGHLAGVKSPLAFNSVMLGEMNDLSGNVKELAQLHMFNRVLSASDPNSCTTFAQKWAKHYGGKMPKSRDEIFRTTGRWYRDQRMAVLLRATCALSLFELMLMCTAPHIFRNDMWIQRFTGTPVAWIPALNGRLLHPNVLLALLRSDLGSHVFALWEKVQWQGELLEDLEYLRTCGLYFSDDEAVLQLTSVDGVAALGAGPLCLDC